MKFTVERDKLHDALGAIIRRSKGGPDIPILSHVLIVATGKSVTLTGHDLDSCSIVSIPVDIAAPGEVAIPADRLHKLSGGLSKGSTMVIETDGSTATVRCGRASYKFGTLPASDFPAALEVKGDPEPINLTAENIARLFDVPSVAISSEETRHYLRGICIHPTRDGIIACATNGHILVKTTAKIERPEFARVIVPERTAREIVSMAKEVGAQICVTEALISVKSGDRTYISKLIDGTFPDYDSVIPQATGAPIKVDAKDIDASLDRLMTARDPKAQAVVRLVWKSGELTASLKSEYGRGDECLEVDCEKDGEVAAQVDYLRAIVASAGGEVVCIDVTDPGTAIRITNPQQDDFVAVCMPCRF